MAKVYVSSTFLDLKTEREEVFSWLRRSGHQAVESYLPDSDTVRDSCLADVDTCDIYVLILGHRYGFQPEEGNSEKLSITHLEFRRARSAKIPCIALVRTSIPNTTLSDLYNVEKLRLVHQFHNEVQTTVRVAQFNNLKELIDGLSTGIHHQIEKIHILRNQNHATVLRRYRASLLERHAYVQLAGIPIPTKGYFSAERDIPLEHAYIKLRVLPKGKPPHETGIDTPAPNGDMDLRDAMRRLTEQQWQQLRTERAYKEAHKVVDVEQLICNDEHRCTVVVGVPGAGKSTLVRYLTMHQAANANSLLPLHIPLRTLDTFLLQKTPNFLEAVLEILTQHEPGEAQVDLRAALSSSIANGRVRFLFDGLDEVRFHLQDVLDGLRALEANKHYVVVTTRPIGYERINKYQDYEILPLLPHDWESFADRWFQVLAPDSSAEAQHAWIFERVNWLKDQLEDRPSLRELAKNPLMLTFLTILAGDEPRRALPRCRKDLYREYVERLFTSWEARRRSQGKLGIGDLNEEKAKRICIWTLHQIAFALQSGYYADSPERLPTREHIESAVGEGLFREWGVKQFETEALSSQTLNFWLETGLLDFHPQYDKHRRRQDWFFFGIRPFKNMVQQGTSLRNIRIISVVCGHI